MSTRKREKWHEAEKERETVLGGIVQRASSVRKISFNIGCTY